jgi:phage portal protein BeeE
MSIIENVMNRFGFLSEQQMTARIGEAVKREMEKVERWQAETADSQRWRIPPPEIFASQADLYRLSPDLGTALDVLSNDIATAKFNVKRMRGEELIDIPNHEFELLLRDPNPMDSGLELMRDTVCNYKLNGNAIWWLNREDEFSKPDEIWAIPYQMIKPVPDGRLYLSHYEYFPGNAKSPLRFELWEIVHFKTYNPHNRFWGLSPLESLITTITGNLGKRVTSKDTYVEHNGMPPGILAFKDWVPNEQWEDIKKEKRQAAKRNEMMMLRGTGDAVSWLQRAMSNKDAEYMDSLKQDMTDVFNRICPGLLAMLSETATEANALAASAFYDDKTLWTMMETIAQKVTPKILPAYGIKLVGIYDDPRYVDRKLKLAEQEAYERTHTVAETRKEFYQDDPLDDERDKELVAQAGKLAKEEPLNAPSNNNGISVPNWPGGQEIPSNEMAMEDTGAEDVTAKAVIDDMKKWRRMAIQGVEKASKADKALHYTSALIPAITMQSIKTRLVMTKDKDTIAKMFDNHIEGMKPKPKLDGLQILKGIELGVKALEKA